MPLSFNRSPLLSNSHTNDILLGAVAASGAGSSLYTVHQLQNTRQGGDDPVIESPITTIIPKLSKAEQDGLPYPPGASPGGRDVDTPYGSIRVYEWGPEDGRKVLSVHGISTPCTSLAGVAEGLVKNGCRVMSFDLFGRGYSAAPSPSLYPQDIRLFTSQILLVSSSSPLSWTGPEGFSLIGYSLGGGIAAAFTSYFPHLVDSLVLIAPAGLLRPHHIHWTSKLLYGGLVPESSAHWLVARRLANRPKAPSSDKQVGPGEAGASEVPHPASAGDSTLPVFPNRPGISVADAVGWQLGHHAGFVPSFVSSIRSAPITAQHDRWRLIRSRLEAQKAEPEDKEKQREGLKEGKVLISLGKDDAVIVANEVNEDAKECLGDGLDARVLAGGHDSPISGSTDVVDNILQFWGTASKA